MIGIKDPKGFWSGVLLLGFALMFMLGALEHPLGSALRMGPAYFPLVLSGLLGLIGVAVLVRGLRIEGEAPSGFRPLAVVLVTASIVLFGLTIRGLGLLGAVPLVVLVSAAASRRFGPVASVLLALGLSGFTYLVFIRLLGLPIPVIGRWLAG